ncbi:placenta growth factor isoform X2 [Salmo trutta]|nr:placenta growth factor-like isoform X2 [Salmo trutta]
MKPFASFVIQIAVTLQLQLSPAQIMPSSSSNSTTGGSAPAISSLVQIHPAGELPGGRSGCGWGIQDSVQWLYELITSIHMTCDGQLSHHLSSVLSLSSPPVLMFQEVWGRSFCRTIEKLVEVVQEYPGEVEHIYSPSCVPLVRCAGCCGDENLECHPTQTFNVTMQLLKIKPGEQGQEYVEMSFVEHQTCE